MRISRPISGFSLIELIVTIALISIVLSISTLSFNSFVRKSTVERYVSELLADLNQVRVRAMTGKQPHEVVFNNGSVVFRRYSSPWDAAGSTYMTKNVPVPVQRTAFGTPADGIRVTFDIQGYVSGSTATIILGSAATNAARDCLVISVSRTNVGKMNANSCEFR